MRIGVDLGGTKIEAAALDDAGIVRARRRALTPQRDYAGTVQTVVRLVREVECEIGETVPTLGLATPGAVSPATGRIKNANSTCLIGERLDADLARALEREVRLANDADCFALSEAVDGAGQGADVVFGVILGTGVGGGIVAHGRLLSGPNAIAGEWGHNPLPWPHDDERPGPECYCGRHGCIETFLSGPGLARASGREDRSAETVVRAAAGGDARAEAVLTRYVERLSRSLAAVINLLDPDVIVLGGGLSNIERLYRDVPALWSEYVFSDRVDTRLLRNVHGDSGGVRGAAWL